jgi:membrane-associated phospholipid phosphatase
MQAISDFGDSAILLPLAIGLVLLVWRSQSWSAAVALLIALAFCVTLTLLLKIGFLACSPSLHAGIVSPSGHTSFSTTVYGALGLVAARHAPPPRLPLIILLTSILIVCIAVSRIAIGVHTVAEVALGMLIGLVAVALFAVKYLRQRAGRIEFALLLAFAACVLLLFHGARLPAEEWIRQLAYLGRGVIGACLGE